MQQSSKKVVVELINHEFPKTILDAPCGFGWLGDSIESSVVIDGIDLFAESSERYRTVFKKDLDLGLPDDLPTYDCVVSCEGVEHFANPGIFFGSSFERLNSGGLLLVTTPNVWYPESRLQFLFRGFFPGFPCLIGRIQKGSHMHIMPWSWPQLYLYLTLSGFIDIQLIHEPISRPKHWWERNFSLPQKLYCRRRMRKSKSNEEKRFWEVAISEASIHSRHLIVTARKPS